MLTKSYTQGKIRESFIVKYPALQSIDEETHRNDNNLKPKNSIVEQLTKM